MPENAYQLARKAECQDPDTLESPGASFLLRVQDAVLEAEAEGRLDPDDLPYEIADDAVPIYNHQMWQTFTDLCAWQEDPYELAGEGEDMNKLGSICLYVIAARLARVLVDERVSEPAEG